MSVIPNFFIVGAPKCGTTALSQYLKNHPSIFISTPKEPHYFAADFSEHRLIRTKKAYLRLYKQADSIKHLAIGEASVWYLYSRIATQLIHSFQQDAKIIVMLRNPVDMLLSLHTQLYNNFYEDLDDFEAAWLIQEYRRQGKNIPTGCLQPEFLQYKQIVLFGEQLKRLYSFFPPHQVKVVFFEKWKDSPKLLYREVLDFLDIPYDGRTEFPVINERYQYRSPTFAKFFQLLTEILRKNSFDPFKGSGFSRENIALFFRKINGKPLEKKAIAPQLRCEIVEEISEDMQLLQDFCQP